MSESWDGAFSAFFYNTFVGYAICSIKNNKTGERYSFPYNNRFECLDAVFFQFATHGIKRVRTVGTDDGAAGAGELGGCSELAGDLHHAAIFLAYG